MHVRRWSMDKHLRRVLILDTDPDTLMALEHLLDGADLDSTTTWDEAEGCQLLERHDFDLILIGDHPPELNATKVLNYIRSRRDCCPALVLSGMIAGNDVEFFVRLGAIEV